LATRDNQTIEYLVVRFAERNHFATQCRPGAVGHERKAAARQEQRASVFADEGCDEAQGPTQPFDFGASPPRTDDQRDAMRHEKAETGILVVQRTRPGLGRTVLDVGDDHNLSSHSKRPRGFGLSPPYTSAADHRAPP